MPFSFKPCPIPGLFEIQPKTFADSRGYFFESWLEQNFTAAAAFSGNLGALLENFVFNSMRMRTTDLYYFSGKGDGECDFIVNPHEKSPAWKYFGVPGNMECTANGRNTAGQHSEEYK